MKNQYIIKPVDQLSNIEILLVLDLWNIDEWKFMEPAEFRRKFSQSEFHFLEDPDDNLLAVSRINFDFALLISGVKYHFAEFAGLVAARKKHGYGLELVNNVADHFARKQMDAIGFCARQLRPFYERCRVNLLRDSAQYIFESTDGELVASTDDDIIVLNVQAPVLQALGSLHASNAGLLLVKSNS